MSTPATTPLPAAPGRAGGPAARSGAPPGETPFAALLDNDQARTATAEGPKSDKPSESRPADRRPTNDRKRDRADETRPETAPRDDKPCEDAAEDRPADAPAPAADPALASPAPPALPAVPVAEAPAPTAPVILPVETPAVPAAAVAVTEAAPVPVAVAPAPVATEAVPAEAVPATPAPKTTDATATAETAPAAEEAAPQKAAPQTGATGEQTAGEDRGEPRDRTAAPAPQLRPAGDERGAQGPQQATRPAVAAEPARTQGADAPRTPEVSTAATPAPAPAAPPSAAARGAVPIEHAQRTVEAALQMAAQRGGVTRARLHLHPAELGAIEIHLRHSANGISARLVAESPEAMAMLQQNGDDLRRSLESAGIDVLGLDIGARGDERRADQGAFASGLGEGSGSGDGADDDATAEATDTVTVPTVKARLPLPGSALLDVLA